VPVTLALMRVVDVYADQGNYAQAHLVAQRVVVTLTKRRPPNHPDVVMAAEADRWLVQRLGRGGECASLPSATTLEPMTR
jgi:hypothetical protein